MTTIIRRRGRSLDDARRWLRQRLDAGVECPCCGQFAKRYRRQLNSGMALALVVFYRECGTQWGYKPDVLRGLGAAARDESLLRHWGLLEEATEDREDGGRAGWWRVTPKGKAFVQGELSVRKKLVIYNNFPEGFEGRMTTVQQALGYRFRLDDLMSA